MRRNARNHSIILLGAASLAVTFSACDSAAESGLEGLIESQSGGDVELDLDGGGFSMQTEDGQMSVDEDGNMIITDADGNIVTGGIDAESGEFNVESEDGSFSIGATTELPEQWPGDVPQPDGLSIESATVIGSDSEQAVSVAGSVSGPEFVDSYEGALLAAGFTEESSFTSEGTINNTYTNGQWTMSVGYYGEGETNQVTISLFQTS